MYSLILAHMRTKKYWIIRVLGQNGPFLKLNVQNGHILKLLFKMASLMPRRRHIIKKYFFRHYSESRSWETRLHFCTKTAVGKCGFIFALKPHLPNAALVNFYLNLKFIIKLLNILKNNKLFIFKNILK